MFVGIDVRGLDNLRVLFKGLPTLIVDAVVDAVTEYLINVYKLYPPKSYISRKAAYGKTFISDRQRRWFFASLGDGSLAVPYKRTQATAQGWRKVGSGATSFIVNEAPGASWTMGPGTQSRHEMLVGWKDVNKINAERASEIDRRANAAADRAIRQAGG